MIYPKSEIGHHVTIHASSVIGSDGYGYVFDEGRHRKMLQNGNVVMFTMMSRSALTPLSTALRSAPP